MGNLKNLKGIGLKTEKYFSNLGIENIKDLLYYFPRDYEEYQRPKKIIDLNVNEIATIDAIVVTRPNVFRKGKITITSVFLDDGTARIRAYWFNIPFIGKQLIVGNRLIFRGKVSQVKNGTALSQCKIYKVDVYESYKGTLSPVYPLTKGLTNNTVKKAIKDLLENCDDKVLTSALTEYLPDSLLKERQLCTLSYAFNHIHFPNKIDDMLIARKRLVYDELFLFSLAMLLSKDKEAKKGRSELKTINDDSVKKIIDKLPYKLTDGQSKAIKDILNDFKTGKKMNRLLEGDVGSGKTIVAFIIALLVAEKGIQSALMVPTEVLAEQHYMNAKKLFKRVALLTGSTKAKERREILEKLKAGEIDFLIGTHALFSKDVEYKDLGLCIIDEQHKFGVSQRKALEDKANNAGLLVMSATPIPRTLSLLLYAGLDISRLKDKPANRLPIKNCVTTVRDREKGYEAIKKEISLKHQAYVICPAIENIDDEATGSFANYQNVTEYANILRTYFGSRVRVEILHGKMKTNEKYDIMKKYKNGEIDVLVSTTVVEVGVDVPNATFMMVEDAGYFGLAELHQLRGRIGRGDAQSYALFIDTNPTDKSRERLNVLKSSNDGFFIAEEDLRLRGPGDIFGVRQSGDMNFRLADMYTDIGIFRQASVDAKEFIDKKMQLTESLKEKINEYLDSQCA